MDSNLFKTKSIEQLVGDVEHGGKALRRSLSAFDLTLLGIGAIIGTGIFVLTGTAAANQAGPAITMSYLAAGLACAFAALCYAEFASMIPIAGSAYTYAYATLGELVAWMIGWDLILEYAVGSMTVAIGWSGYMQRLMAGFGIELPLAIGAAPPVGIINLPAVIIVLLIMILLVVGVRESARFNAVMVAIKVAAVLFFLAAGITYVEPTNWQPFAPYGWPGIMAAAAVVFFAYIGFDAVSTTAEEAKNPQRDLPIGIIASLVICTVLYLAVGAVLTGIVPVVQFRAAEAALPGMPMVQQEQSIQFLNAPVAYALAFIGQGWAAGLVSAGAVAGITSVLLVMLMSQPRIFFSMSRDRLLPQGVSKVHPRFGTPYITTIITCVHCGAGRGADADPSGRRDDQHWHAVRVRRGLRGRARVAGKTARCRSAVPRAVRTGVPGPRHPLVLVPDVEPAGADLGPVPGLARPRHDHLLGLRPYAQPAGESDRTNARTPMQSLANFITTFGLLLIFNAGCIALLGFMTMLGITNETTAKWSELESLGLSVTAEEADAFGLRFLVVAVAVWLVGFGLTKASGEKG